MHPGGQVEVEPQRREALPEVRCGQQDEPGLALSPDGPGASPEPPSLSHTPDGNATTDTLASDMLRKLAGTTVCVCVCVCVCGIFVQFISIERALK